MTVTQCTYVRNASIFDIKADAIVNPVNTKGICGAGLALEFKKRYPDNYELYKKACQDGICAIGKCYLTKANTNVQYIINFPTKDDWRDKSDLKYIQDGMDSLIVLIDLYKIQSIALPMLGCGLGGLNHKDVLDIVVSKLWNKRGIDFSVCIGSDAMHH